MNRTIVVNSQEWEVIIPTTQEEFQDQVLKAFKKEERLYGFCEFDNEVIYLDPSIKESRILSVLIHELVHVYLFEHNHQKKNHSEEDMCHFLGAYAEEIVDKARNFMERLKREKELDLGYEKHDIIDIL